MFTGIVESTAAVQSLTRHAKGGRLILEKVNFGSELSLGESVAINGVCLTVVEWTASTVTFDLLEETLRITNLGELKPATIVNLERAMQAHTRFSGHFVQGHVDTTGEVLELSAQGQDHCFRVAVPAAFRNLLVLKGSITVDGMSLTIADISPEGVTIWITPHTYAVTSLAHLKPGWRANLEFDVIAKHIDQMLTARLGAGAGV